MAYTSTVSATNDHSAYNYNGEYLLVKRRLRPILDRVKSMPASGRTIIGILLLIGGFLGVLPVLGFWMIPLGLIVLSTDWPWARRAYLSVVVWLRKKRDRRRQKKNSR